MMLDTLFAQDLWFFTIAAIVGGGVFILKMAMMGLGGFGGGGGGGDIAGGGGVSDLGADGDAHDSDASFSILSTQAIAAFLMGFGTAGLAARMGFELSLWASVAIGAGFGVFLMWLLAIIMRAVWGLQNSGNIHPRDAVGRAGTVYTNVPDRTSGGGRGQVRIVIGDRARTYNAVSTGAAIPTGTSIKVTALEGQTLVVSAS